MRSKDKRMMAGNRTIDQFLVRKDVSAPFSKAKHRLRVPQSSGYPPSTPPITNILVHLYHIEEIPQKPRNTRLPAIDRALLRMHQHSRVPADWAGEDSHRSCPDC